jgi:hypothetical protein
MALLRSIRILFHAVLFAAAWSTFSLPAAAQGAEREYAVKAVFLYNFCRFITWPDSAFAAPDTPITIGIFGEDPFGTLLEETVKGERVRGRRIRIMRTKRIEDIPECHVLFVSRSEMGRLEQILAAARTRSVVTVAESEAFLTAGGMIALTTQHGKVRLRISTGIIQAANLKVSSRLLHIASQR